jgi:hypothetical protein
MFVARGASLACGFIGAFMGALFGALTGFAVCFLADFGILGCALLCARIAGHGHAAEGQQQRENRKDDHAEFQTVHHY